jgi:acyl transferase domain-containing protein/NAD(P)-dependent dehydrogenase (short-subunit alcohol dehydrogenase family)/acyl carrier protein
MGCLLPGARDVPTFWRNLLAKVDFIQEIPAERFDYNLYFDKDRKARDRIYSKWGGFLEEIEFDPMRYGIPPAALSSIDPFQLLAVEVVHQALEDADYLKKDFPKDRTAVILGISGGLGDLGLNYGVRSLLPTCPGGIPPELSEHLPEWTEDSFAGLLLNVAAGRVANRFGFGGVNYTVDAACASSLAAVYLATRELDSGASDVAIVGGVDTTQSPFGYLCFSSSQALSPTGRCRTFDASADGIVISEGLAVLVLKRLEDAERDGDRIYAVIKGVAGSSDGKGRSLTAPRPEGQVLALQRAYEQAQLSPATVGLVEAHGTGTVAGDAAEVASLCDVFQGAGAAPGSCALGSVKSMIGHTKSAAGVTGLMKVALALHHKVLPPTLHVSNPNPRLREPDNPFFVNTEALPWVVPSPETRRRAGVSSFGFGGTNFHAVVEEYRSGSRGQAKTATQAEWPGELFYWTAASAAELETSLATLEGSLARSRPRLRDLALTTWASSSSAAGARLSIVASSVDDLAAKIGEARRSLGAGEANQLSDARGIYLSVGQPAPPKLALLFPGQGSQYVHMLRDLTLHFPEVTQSLACANRVLAGSLPRPLSSYVFPPPAFTPEEEATRMAALTDTAVAQPALGAVEMGLTRLLTRLGIRADMTAGHSYGEYVALWAAGVLPDEALMEVSAARGRYIKESVGEAAGTMLAVRGSREVVGEALRGLEGIWLANFNAPQQTIIAGPAGNLEKATARLAEKGLSSRPIPVACAFHTPLMAGAKDRLAERLAGLSFAKPAAEVFSNTTAAPFPEETGEIAAILREHLVRPVDFEGEIRAMYERGARVFLEVGPKAVLTGLVRQILAGKEATVISLDGGDGHGITQLLHALGRLAVLGFPVDAAALFEGRSARVLPGDLVEAAAPVSAWVVNGGRCRLRATPVKPFEPKSLPLREEPPAPKMTSGTDVSQSPAAPTLTHMFDAKDSIPNGPIRAVSPPPTDLQVVTISSPESDGVMAQFQDVMRQFLEVQASVMTAYLQGGAGLPVAETPRVPRSLEATPAAPAVAPLRTATASPPPEAVAQNGASIGSAAQVSPTAPESNRRDIAAELLDIASARTGYPAEMLGLDVNIEADLGIDSIKRIEILSLFQKSCPAAQQEKIQAVMDRLNNRKTLREIAEILAEALGSAAQPADASADSRPPASAGKRDIAAALLEIASARTGYPADMLGLDVNIEADLGIDSIKRVEILTAFQKGCPAHEQARIQSVMDRLNSRKTLREIAQTLGEALGQSPLPAAASAVSVPPASEARRDIAAELLEIASARTGYPTEMLGLDVNIEADLGIDSIKRVEILTVFQKAFPPEQQEKIQAAMDRLNSRKTLREIVDVLSASLNGSLSPARVEKNEKGLVPGAAEVPANGKPTAVPRFVMKAVEAPLAASSKRRHRDRLWVISDEESGIAAALAGGLRESGERAVLLQHRDRAVKPKDNVYFADLRRPEGVEKALESIRGKHGPIGAVVHLLPLRKGPGFWQMSLGDWRDRVQLEIKSLYALARFGQSDLVARAKTGGARFCVVTAMGGTFATEPKPEISPIQAGVAGFLKTFSLEVPEIVCKAIDVDGSQPSPALAEKLMAEVSSDDETLEVGYAGDRRITLVPRVAQLNNGPAGLMLDRESVVLLTGGARGITAEIAGFLAAHYLPTLILAGLSPLPQAQESLATAGLTDPKEIKAALLSSMGPAASPCPAEVEAKYQRLLRDREITRNLEKLRSAGARVEYHQLDVRDEQAMAAVLDHIYRSHGRLDMVIHGAGIIEDKLLRDKTPDSFDRVLQTKVDSAFTLVRKLRPGGLKALIFMSSITATFGNRGQCDYAAANGVLNGLSTLLSAHWPGRVVALNWGPWDKMGMASAGVRSQFLERGIHLIAPESGVVAAALEIQAGSRSEPVVALGDGPWAMQAEHPRPRPGRAASAVAGSAA